MTVVNKGKIANSLLSKGFREDRKKDHRVFRLFVNGRRTRVITKISHGAREYDDHLLNLMAREMYLSKDELIKFIYCEIDYAEYFKILKEKAIL
ncbi:hypothetical protein DMB44_04840 [Thermoplasma sp. Kam2015]|uniref:hypothetical protein n=1 Tax=Thermoplasma sp. Kam2015 TaxID=2094122 RepID=UPI000D812774|nr:hypothetical protein [Thermoplasma sp. Kam2015]PYB68274.1 hypothetical protein DMB44_04840 [Thermoplasma sp. Kam2015]